MYQTRHEPTFICSRGIGKEQTNTAPPLRAQFRSERSTLQNYHIKACRGKSWHIFHVFASSLPFPFKFQNVASKTSNRRAKVCPQDESGSRRRRKGRPSRRAKTERRWQTADLCLSPQEDEEGGGPAGWEEKDCPGKSTSRTSSNAVFNTRKG